MASHNGLVYLAVLLTGVLCSQADDDAYYIDSSKLYKSLMTGYLKSVAPLLNRTTPIELEIGFGHARLETLDTFKDTLTLSFMLQMSWVDPRLQWNATEFGLTQTRLPSSEIWKPDFTLYNTSPYLQTHEVDEINAVVLSSGVVYYIPLVTMSSFCGLDLLNFPYDTQTCTMVMGSWTYNGKEIKLKLQYTEEKTLEIKVDDGETGDYYHPQWDIEHMVALVKATKYACCPEPYYTLDLETKLTRRSSYHRFVLVGPSVLVAFLVPVLFLLPVDSENRSNYGLLLLLSTTMLILVLQEAVPFNHVSVPKIAYYFFVTMVLEVVSIVLSSVVSWTAGKGKQNRPIPAWLNSVCLNSRAVRRLLCMDLYSPVNTMSSTMNMRLLEESNDITDHEVHGHADLQNVDMATNDGFRDVANSTKIMAGDVLAKNAYAKISHEWMEIARFLDRLFFVAFFIMFVVTTLSCLF